MSSSKFPWTKAFKNGDPALDRVQQNDTLLDTIGMISNDIDKMGSIPLDDVAEISTVVDHMVELLSDLWNDSSDSEFNYLSFLRVTTIVDKNVTHICSKVLDGGRITRRILKQIASLCESYVIGISQICSRETSQRRVWPASNYTPNHVASYETLTRKYQTIHLLLDDIQTLLTQEDQELLKFESVATSINILLPKQLISLPRRLWDIEYKRFESQLIPLEKAASSKLHPQLMTSQKSPEILLQAFKAHSALLSRPIAFAELGHEFSETVIYIVQQIQRIRKEMDERFDFTPVENLVWYNQKKSLIELFDRFFKAVPQNQSVQDDVSGAKNDLRNFYKMNMKNWIMNIQSKLGDTIILPSEQSLVEFGDHTDGLIVVNFSNDLYQFLEDFRNLKANNVDLPSNVSELAKKAEPFLQKALIMQRVGMFYNSMTDRVMKCHRSMLYQPVLEFEQLVNSARNLASRNSAQVLPRLQNSLSSIMVLNSDLSKKHNEIIDNIQGLFHYDLLDHQKEWQSTISAIRSETNKVAQTFSRSQDWMNYLDSQIYKALSYQLRSSILYLVERPAQFTVELVISNNRIDFKPTIAETRRLLYSTVNSLLNYTIKFKGLSTETTNFANIAKGAPQELAFAYSMIEEMLSELHKFASQFNHWAILAQNLSTAESIAREMRLTSAEWKSNFYHISNNKSSINQIDNYVTVGFFKVDLTLTKEEFRRLLSQFQSVLLKALRDSLKDEFVKTEEFVNDGLKLMSETFDSPQAIGEARKRFTDLVRGKVETELTFDSIKEKVGLLHQFESIDKEASQFSKLKAAWQQLTEKMESFDDRVVSQFDNVKQKIIEDFHALSNNIRNLKLRWDEIKPKNVDYDDDSVVVTVPQILSAFEEQFNDAKQQYEANAKIMTDFDEPHEVPEIEEIQEELDMQKASIGLLIKWREQYTEFTTQLWSVISLKLFQFEDFLNNWASTLQNEPTSDVVLYIDGKVNDYKSVYPMLKFIRGDDWCEEHWRAFYNLVGIPMSMNSTDLTLRDMLDANEGIKQNIKKIKDIAEKARGEATIRKSLEEISTWFSTTQFQWFEHVFASRKTFIFKEWKQLLSDLADNQSLVSSLKDSPFIKAFQDDIDLWDSRILSLSNNLHLLNDIQRKWLHLEPVFLKKALPDYQTQFEEVDTEFRKILESLRQSKKASGACSLDTQSLEKMLHRLEQLNKALNTFLELKRDNFSRFYFIGDDDLLEIIGLASEDPHVVQSHLKKLFQGIHSVVFDEKNIVAIKSSMGEVVKLQNPVKCDGLVEEWLTKLSSETSDTLIALLNEMLSKRQQEIMDYPSQLALLYYQIEFTKLVESNPKDIDKLREYVNNNLHKLISYDFKTELQRYTSRSLIIEFVRFRQILDEYSPDSIWSWNKQLRFYLEDKRAIAEMGDAKIRYGYEYQGNPARLVYTPLTAKCYLALCEGISLGYGGNPYGPAGTGKTESVKALGQALGRQVLVFNCDEAIDVQSMCRIFTGLVMGGAWGCFDEFNRLDEEVLSALSQQIQVIQASLLSGSKSVDLNGRKVSVNSNAGIYVTLNPAGKGYGGRSKLPSNLTQLFRAVAMSAPDQELIAEVLMYSNGFHLAEKLSRQLVLAFSLCKQLLSPEIHYDWGLRALKSILSTAGQWLDAAEGEIDETSLLVKAMNISTLSKLTFADRIVFEQIIKDCFPDAKNEHVEAFELRQAAAHVLETKKLVHLPNQIEKMLQMWEALNQRTGVVIVGPSGCGKTTLWSLLKDTLDEIGVKVNVEVMNPKSMPRQRLIGHVDLDTREWLDGVLTRAARNAVSSPERSWIICDGDIDPEWIESLNSVLDDNRLLTLPNGERIQFDNRVNFIFETHSLEHASPATVSRMAVILLSSKDLTIENACSRWLSEFPKESRITQLFEGLFYPTVYELIDKPLIVKMTNLGVVQNVQSHLSKVTGDSDSQFLNCLIRGTTSLLEPSMQQSFASDIYKRAIHMGLNLAGIDPSQLLDQTFINGSVKTFEFHPTPPTLPSIESNRLFLVQTPEVQRTLATIRPWIEEGLPVMLVGPRGSGKSTHLRHIFKSLPSTNIIEINCSAQTNADTLMAKLLQHCALISTAKGQVLRPRSTERTLVFFQNFDLPRPDKWGTTQIVAFMQQLLTHGGFYNESLQWVQIERIQFVFAMSTSERRPMSTRFTSVVRVCAIHETTEDQLDAIYNHYIQTVLAKTPIEDKAAIVTSGMIRTYLTFRREFRSDVYPHYDFSLRDLSKWVIRLQRYTKDTASFNSTAIFLEGTEIFVNRLAQQSDRTRMKKQMLQIFDGFVNEDSVFTNLPTPNNDNPPLYLVESSQQNIETAVNKVISSYEREMGPLNVFKTADSIHYCSIISSLMAIPGSNVVFITSPGMGMSDLLKAVCHSSGIEIFTPTCTVDFGFKTFSAFLKENILRVSQKSEEQIILIEDFHFVDSRIIDSINSLMSSGEVSGLFTQAEFDSLVASVQSELRESGQQIGAQEFFCQKIKRLIHVVIMLNPLNMGFKGFFSFAPAFISDSEIVWATEMSNTSLSSIPTQILVDDSVLFSPEQLGKISPMFAAIANSIDEQPVKFEQFVRLYKKLYKFKHNQLTSKRNHLDIGLSKLNEAAKTVDDLSSIIGTKKANLSVKEKAANEAMEQISQAVAACSEQQAKIEAIQKNLTQEESKLHQEQAKIDAELATIQPTIDAAKKLVSQIRRDQLAEVRGFQKPHEDVIIAMSGVLAMLGQNDTSWQSIKRTLAQDGFTREIMNFDASTLTADTIRKVQKLLKQHPESFDFDNMQRISVAVAPLTRWIKANLSYFTILEKVEPLRQQSEEFSKRISQMTASIADLKKKKKEVDAVLVRNQEEFKSRTQEAEQLKNELKIAEQNLSDAETLFTKLKDERTRWDNQRSGITAALSKLPKDVLISAAVCAYGGPHPEDVRRGLIQKWLPAVNASSESNFDLAHFLYSDSQLLKLRRCLSGDSLSLENAVIMSNLVTVPLIIDPTARVVEWLSTTYPNATVLPRSHERFASELSLHVRLGKVLIITELDTIDPIFVSIIRKDLQYSGSKSSILVGDREFEYNESFRLFLVTRNPDPQIDPTIQAYISVVNFSTTLSGLESSLLAMTLEKELPKIQTERAQLIASEEEMKGQLENLEVALLQSLVEADSDNILSNTTLIETLNRTKEQAGVVSENLIRIESLSKSLEEKAQVYRPLAQLGAKLYFAIASLDKLDYMYRFSSSLFMHLFSQIFNTQINATGEFRVSKFQTELTRTIYHHVSSALFKKHRLAAALHIIRFCYPNMISEKDFNVFVSESSGNADVPKWIPAERASAYAAFQNSAPELCQSLKFGDPKHFQTWIQWLKQDAPEENWPTIENQPLAKRGLSPFMQIVIISVLAPHRLAAAAESFVTNALQLNAFSPQFDLVSLFSSNRYPIIFIVSPGADPSAEIQTLSSKMNRQLCEIAVGQDLPEGIIKTVEEAARDGRWVLIKNAHLSVSLTQRLEKAVSALTERHENFQLILTTEVHNSFPSLLLSNSIKVAFEAPPGLRANLIRTLGSTEKDAPLSTASSLAYFHAVIQERRTFIPQGWTKFYEFSSADYACAMQILKQSKHSGNFEFIRGILSLAVYGGRVDNDFDFDVLGLLLEKFVQENANVLRLERTSKLSDAIKRAERLPERDDPREFDLPPNAMKTVALAQTRDSLTFLRRLAALGGGSEKISHDQWIAFFTSLLRRWELLIKNNSSLLTQTQTQPSDESPIASALYSQSCIIHSLLNQLASFFDEVREFVQGNETMTHSLEKRGNVLIQGEVPDEWYDISDGPNSPAEWLEFVVLRANVIDSLAIDHSSVGTGIELGMILRPTALLNALRQETARITGTPIVDLELAFSIGDSKDHSICITDISLQGAVLQGMKIAQMTKDEPVTMKCPVCSLSWEPKGNKEKVANIPLYSDSTRSKFIISLPTACLGDSNVFRFAGTAFIIGN